MAFTISNIQSTQDRERLPDREQLYIQERHQKLIELTQEISKFLAFQKYQQEHPGSSTPFHFGHKQQLLTKAENFIGMSKLEKRSKYDPDLASEIRQFKDRVAELKRGSSLCSKAAFIIALALPILSAFWFLNR